MELFFIAFPILMALFIAKEFTINSKTYKLLENNIRVIETLGYLGSDFEYYKDSLELSKDYTVAYRLSKSTFGGRQLKIYYKGNIVFNNQFDVYLDKEYRKKIYLDIKALLDEKSAEYYEKKASINNLFKKEN
jgi:hypothetical protein